MKRHEKTCRVPAFDRRRRDLLLTQRALRRGEIPPPPSKPDDGETNPIYPFTKGIVLVNDGVAYGERVSEKRYRPKACKLEKRDVESWVGEQTRSGRRWDRPPQGAVDVPPRTRSKDGEK